MDKADAILGRDILSARLGGNDGDLTGADLEMAQQQRQDTLADAAKADDNETAGEGDVLLFEHGGRALIVNSEVPKVALPREDYNRLTPRLMCGRFGGDYGKMRKLVTAVVVGTLLATGFAFAQAKSNKGAGYEQLNLFSEAYDRIRQDAVEPVGEGKLIGAAIAGMLSGLDARSGYISEAAFKAMQQTPANDDKASLGLVVTIENGQLKVISPQDGSPAAQAGIKPGDLIFSIDKELTYDLTLGDAEQKLRGPAGSEVELTLRRGNGGPIKIKIKREPYRLQTVAAKLEAWEYRLFAHRRLRQRHPSSGGRRSAGSAATGRQQADRLYPRFAEQSGRQLRGGGRRRRCLHRQG